MTTTNATAVVDMVQVRPFLLKPKFAERVWGKTDLKPWYDATGTAQPVGEAWLTGAACVIEGGPLAGRTLEQVVAETQTLLGDGEFPLLVKMLFPADKLSVQVHPDDEQARALGLARGKTECWYVVDATAGAQVACGVKAGVSLEQLEASAKDGSMESMLNYLEVEAGDMIFVDAGTVHAIGPGMTLLEVQQTCDVTYRLFDYGRPRELHLEQGMGVVKLKTRAGKVKARKNEHFTRLIEETYFTVDLFELEPGATIEMAMDGIGCVVGIEGKAAVNEVRFGRGQAVVAPVGSMSVSSEAGAKFVRCWEAKK